MSPQFGDNRRDTGLAKEELASRYLQAQGLQLLARNYRCAAGEVDLIMRHGKELVFVEVRFRHSATHGTPAETVTRTKQGRIARAAAHYLQRHPGNPPCRFDMVGIEAADRIDWIPDAFRLEA